MELSTRALSVLREIVERYIRTGSAVASQQVARSPRQSLSSATIRSVIAQLERHGLVERAHASAGSVPTDEGFRKYVDAVLPSRRLPPVLRRTLRERVATRSMELMTSMEGIARLTAEATRETGVAVRPMGDDPVLETVSLVSLGGGRVLGVVVTADGAVDKRVLTVDHDVARDDLDRISSLLGGRFRGRTPAAIARELRQRDPVPGCPPVLRSLLVELGGQLFARTDSAEVVVAAAHHLLQAADIGEIERAREALATINDRSRLVHEWRRGFARSRTHVVIGRESDVTAASGLAMVATLFYRQGRRVGALGVIGPRRMDYGRIVPMVELIGDTLTDAMEEGESIHA